MKENVEKTMAQYRSQFSGFHATDSHLDSIESSLYMSKLAVPDTN
jgi:hypothetical protein